jgi:hypothetical protein
VRRINQVGNGSDRRRKHGKIIEAKKWKREVAKESKNNAIGNRKLLNLFLGSHWLEEHLTTSFLSLTLVVKHKTVMRTTRETNPYLSGRAEKKHGLA